jgi:hypothetical protein
MKYRERPHIRRIIEERKWNLDEIIENKDYKYSSGIVTQAKKMKDEREPQTLG